MSEQPEQVPDGPATMPFRLLNGTRTSQGPGPGVKYLPPAEGNLLVARKLAVAGTEPPRGFEGTPEPSTRPFDDNYMPHGSRADDGLRH